MPTARFIRSYTQSARSSPLSYAALTLLACSLLGGCRSEEIERDDGASATAVEAVRAEAAPSVSAEIALDAPAQGAMGTNRESNVSQASGPDGQSLVVWIDDRNLGGASVFGVRVGADGTVLDAPAKELSTGSGVTGVRAISDGTRYLVVWSTAENLVTTGDIYGTFLSPDGVIGATFPIQNGNSYSGGTLGVDVVWNAARGEFFAVYADERNYNPDMRDLFGLRLSATGERLGDEVQLSSGPSDQLYPSLATDGDGYFLVYTGWTGPREAERAQLFGVRISAQGAVVGSAFPVSNETEGHQRRGVVAFGGGRYVVAWEDARTSTMAVRAARFERDGTSVDAAQALTVASGAWEMAGPQLRFDGSRFLVVWDDLRQGGSRKANHDVYGAVLLASGAVDSVNGYALAAERDGEGMPALTVTSSGEARVAYTRSSSSWWTPSQRARLRRVLFP